MCQTSMKCLPTMPSGLFGACGFPRTTFLQFILEVTGYVYAD